MKTRISANQFIVTSTLSVKDIKFAQRNTLNVVKDDDGNDVYGVYFQHGVSGKLTPNMAIFNTGGGKAQLTIPLPGAPKDYDKCITEEYAVALCKLAAFEAELEEKVSTLKGTFTGILNAIERDEEATTESEEA